MKQSRWSTMQKRYWTVKVLVIILIIFVDACVHDPIIKPVSSTVEQPVTPGPTPCAYDGTVCFESSVLPIFLSTCAKSGCHDASSRQDGYVLDGYSTIVSRGVARGNANGSKLYRALFDGNENTMPPDAPLSQAQKDSIASWINQGAKNTVNCNCNCDSTKFTYAAVIDPLLSSNCVGCHEPGSLEGNIDLSTYANVKAQALSGRLLGSVQHSAGYSPMPQGGKLSDCQISQLRNWINAGAGYN